MGDIPTRAAEREARRQARIAREEERLQEEKTAIESGQVQITPTAEAAIINVVMAEIGDWSRRKGFREDYEDSDWLDELVALLAAGEVDEEIHLVMREDGKARMRRVAKRHREMANTTKLMLMVSELSEALEGQRNEDHDNYGEELADVMIRAMENAEANGIPIGDIILRKMAVNEERPHKHGRNF